MEKRPNAIPAPGDGQTAHVIDLDGRPPLPGDFADEASRAVGVRPGRSRSRPAGGRGGSRLVLARLSGTGRPRRGGGLAHSREMERPEGRERALVDPRARPRPCLPHRLGRQRLRDLGGTRGGRGPSQGRPLRRHRVRERRRRAAPRAPPPGQEDGQGRLGAHGKRGEAEAAAPPEGHARELDARDGRQSRRRTLRLRRPLLLRPRRQARLEEGPRRPPGVVLQGAGCAVGLRQLARDRRRRRVRPGRRPAQRVPRRLLPRRRPRAVAHATRGRPYMEHAHGPRPGRPEGRARQRLEARGGLRRAHGQGNMEARGPGRHPGAHALRRGRSRLLQPGPRAGLARLRRPGRRHG